MARIAGVDLPRDKRVEIGINLFLCQFCVGVQKPGKTVHYKNQDRTDIFILRRLDVITFDLFQNGIPQMLCKAVHR